MNHANHDNGADLAMELVAAKERERRADEALAAATESKRKATRDVEIFRKKLHEAFQRSPDMVFLVGQRIVQRHPHSGDVQVIVPSVVDEKP